MSVSMTMLLQTSMYAILLGLFFGASYDFVRIIRVFCGVSSYKKIKTGFNRIYSNKLKNYFDFKRRPVIDNAIVFAGDVIYFLFITLCFVLFLFKFNYGIFRWFILASTVVGFLLYYFTVGRIVMLFSRELSELFKLITNCFIFVITRPFIIIFRLCKVILKRIILSVYFKLKCGIDIRRKKRYTVLCKEKLKELIKI